MASFATNLSELGTKHNLRRKVKSRRPSVWLAEKHKLQDQRVPEHTLSLTQSSGILNKKQRRLAHWQEQCLVMEHFSRLQNM